MQALAGPRVTENGLRRGGEGAPIPAPPASTDLRVSEAVPVNEDELRRPLVRSAYGADLQAPDPAGRSTTETNGRLLAYVRHNTLTVTDVSTASPADLGVLKLHGVTSSQLLFTGSRALVLGSSSRLGRDLDPSGARFSTDGGPVAGLAVVDLADPARPRRLSHEAITGRIVTARLDGDVAHVVLASTPDLPFLSPGARDDRSAAALAANRAVIHGATAPDWLPARVVYVGDDDVRTTAGPLLDCRDVRAPLLDSGVEMLTVLTIDLTRDEPLSDEHATAVVTAGELARLEAGRALIATTRGGWGGTTSDWFYDERTEGTATAPDPGGRTAVHKFDTTDPAGARYVASGALDGYLPGGWAMSGDAGNVRAVTTALPAWLPGARDDRGPSTLAVLRPRAAELAEVGRLAVGHGRPLYGVAWFGHLAAVLTTRQSDPAELVELGASELTVRGTFPAQGSQVALHLVDGDRLLALDDGRHTGASEGRVEFTAFDLAGGGDLPPTGRLRLPPSNSGLGNFVSRAGTGLLTAEISGVGSNPGLISIRLGPDGAIATGPRWIGRDDPDPDPDLPYAAVQHFVLLPGGRVAALDQAGVWVLDATTLHPLGHIPFGRAKGKS